MNTIFDLIHPALESSTLIIINSLVKDFWNYNETYLFSFIFRPAGLIIPELKPEVVSPAKISAEHMGLYDVFLNPTLPGELILNGYIEGIFILMIAEIIIMQASKMLAVQSKYIFWVSLVPIAFFTYRFDFSYMLYSAALCFLGYSERHNKIPTIDTWDAELIKGIEN